MHNATQQRGGIVEHGRLLAERTSTLDDARRNHECFLAACETEHAPTNSDIPQNTNDDDDDDDDK